MASALMAVAMLAGACGGSDSSDASDGPNPFDIAPGDGVIVRSMAGELDLTVTGSVTASWKGTTPIQVLTQVSPNQPRSSWLLQVGLLDPVDADGVFVRPAFDLIGYAGDGTYTIEAPKVGELVSGSADETVASALHSDAFLVIGSGAAGDEAVMWSELVEPCSLEVHDQGTRGEVRCDRVTAPGGEIAFSWSWTATEVLSTQDFGTGSGTDAEGQQGEPVTESTSTTAATGGPTTTTAPADGDGSSEANMAFDLTVSPLCVTNGDTVTASLATEPAASLSMAAAFSDAKTYGLQGFGVADPTGHFTWTFVVPPDAPAGTAHVLMAGSSADGSRAGRAIVEFEVRAQPC